MGYYIRIREGLEGPGRYNATARSAGIETSFQIRVQEGESIRERAEKEAGKIMARGRVMRNGKEVIIPLSLYGELEIAVTGEQKSTGKLTRLVRR